MPHINPPAPAMPRLAPPESDHWFAKVKALPFHSENFNCILPGCPNSYQTKQGLERHFISIHMPKIPAPTKHTRSDARASSSASLSNTNYRRSSTAVRKGRIKSHRKGRPPGSGLKNRLKQQGIQQELDPAQTDNYLTHTTADHHTNHSLLANHPASTRHDYGCDDENKPREERSYLEFFPFLNVSQRLEIVNIATEKSLVNTVNATNNTNHGHTSTNNLTSEQTTQLEVAAEEVKAESSDVSTIRTNLNEAYFAGQNPPLSANDMFHNPGESIQQSQTHKATDNTPSVKTEANLTVDTDEDRLSDIGMDVEYDGDGDAGSDPDVFFDAKGFIDSEAESSQKPNTKLDRTVTNSKSQVNTAAKTINGNGSAIKDGDDKLKTQDMDAEVIAETNHTGAYSAKDRPKLQNNDSSVNNQRRQEDKEKNRSSSQAPVNSHSIAPLATTSLEPKTPMALLPKSSFKLIPREDDDLEEYHLPAGHNVRYIEPTETELAERVEYDMDEQDEFWLKEVNAERRKQDLGEVSASLFEKIIDRLEKEWFDLTKNIPKSAENLPPEDSACNICDDGECENSNAIVFCDGCNLAVHQDCYGIPYIPEGQWLCRKCMLSPQMPVSCIFCPGEGGAFKQTTNSRWAHLLCASWIPEVGVANTVYMEPIDNIDKIPASRWRLTCYICKLRMGACIQCETKNCFRAFHVTCARKAHLYMKSKVSKVSSSGGEVLVYRAHCHKHTPRDYKGSIDIAGAAALFAHKGIKKKRNKIRPIDDDSDDPDYGRSDEDEKSRLSIANNDKSGTVGSLAASQVLGGSRTSKAALAHQKHYTPGAPLAPMFIVNRLLPFVSKLGAKTSAMRKVSALNFVYTICKYWSLKRESRRGAPLLKRLHLEPWTASASAHRQTEEEKLKKLQTQLLLRGDLEKVRMLAELVRKRERAKLKRQELQNRYLCKIMFPLKTILEDTLAELEKLDRQKYFAYPISTEEVKDYHEIIKNPICFQTMNEKLAAHKYQSIEEFADDARRIYHNCLTYNKVDTPYYRAASRQLKQAEPLLQKAKEDYECLEIDPRTGFLAIPIDPEIFTYNLIPFHKSEDDESATAIVQEKAVSEDAVSTPASSHSSKPKRKEVTLETPKIPFVTSRALRATSGRTALKSGGPTAPLSPQETRRGLNQTPGFRAPSRSAVRPEVPKLKTATMTRADVAKARQAGESSAVLTTLDEEDLLEKLKQKSKKSRSLAVNLQSRLKPSIVDKVVEVINKPAPKGWAYVVVEGEEDSTEGEDEAEDEAGSVQAEMDPEALALAKAKEEHNMRRKMERKAEALKKKLAKEKRAKERAEKYAQMKAMKTLTAASPQPSGSTRSLSSGALPPAKLPSQESRYVTLRSRRGHPGQQSKEREIPSNDSAKPQKQQECDLADGVKDIMTRTSVEPMDPKGLTFVDQKDSLSAVEHGDLAAENEEKLRHVTAQALSTSERLSRGKQRRADSEEDTISNHLGKLNVTGSDSNANVTGEIGDTENDISYRNHHGTDVLPMLDERSVITELEPPRKRQKRTGSGRIPVPAKDDTEGESTVTRRLRSTETATFGPSSLPSALSQRRSSFASQRGFTKGVSDMSGE
ncbi:hypothetical protein BCR41DRAFT_425300 [Lobosporangium transversale]|uniref:Peregrin n=1 Tax=Lobosporangium transversale TaxID=64571 RepID=A0A1Y2GAU1_9FUNG|nr:hypothetical protein BCR41DRAFT_425300 [Lobosporangium transversale]ORZ05888.1 hypothetical protein BCR41DRAFT_425300 [Lobosporangium transversale]|eukprot:XP_021877269.1 hypothetical protein BCR41DRAFT_425300 [Lobosporangium transversale]